MAVREQITSRNALQRLRTQPLAFLQNTRLTVGLVPGGVDTTDESLSFGVANGQAYMGPAATVAALCMSADPVIHNVDVHATAMRTALLGAARTAATARVNMLAGADLWVTVRQTGCSVLVLDWGAALSMVHLQPSLSGQYQWRILRRLTSSANRFGSEVHRYSLRSELTQVVAATRGVGPAPLRYILVQSNSAIASGHWVGVTGTRSTGAWQFFMQKYTGAAVVEARQLNWTAWHEWGRYAASVY